MLAEYAECDRILGKLKQIVPLLDPQQDINILTDINYLADRFSNPNLVVSVFGSLNRGKSTLLNALLGQRLLPTSLMPTARVAIDIKYGTELGTRAIRADGTKIDRKGIESIHLFSKLNSEQQRRANIVSLEMFLPHPLLKNGIELIDLPGTNNCQEQDEFISNKLLATDLAIDVLDASQLFTLTEVQNLQYWLIDREIKNVIFVVNFLNLLEVQDQIKVMRRARLLAKEFVGNLPDGISNLYRVDALPALKAKRKGDSKTAFSTGILNFESALQNIANVLANDLYKYRLPRAIKICDRVKQSLEAKIKRIEEDLEILTFEHSEQIQEVEVIAKKHQLSKLTEALTDLQV